MFCYYYYYYFFTLPWVQDQVWVINKYYVQMLNCMVKSTWGRLLGGQTPAVSGKARGVWEREQEGERQHRQSQGRRMTMTGRHRWRMLGPSCRGRDPQLLSEKEYSFILFLMCDFMFLERVWFRVGHCQGPRMWHSCHWGKQTGIWAVGVECVNIRSQYLPRND